MAVPKAKLKGGQKAFSAILKVCKKKQFIRSQGYLQYVTPSLSIAFLADLLAEYLYETKNSFWQETQAFGWPPLLYQFSTEKWKKTFSEIFTGQFVIQSNLS